MLSKSGHRGLSITMGAQLLCLVGTKNVGVQDWAVAHLVDSQMLVLPPLLSTGHMAMNADLLAPSIPPTLYVTCACPMSWWTLTMMLVDHRF